MHRPLRLDLVFLVVLSVALILLVYLSAGMIHRINDTRDLIKAVGTLLLPIPFALYAVTISLSYQRIQQEEILSRRQINFSVFLFLISLSGILAALFLFDPAKSFRDNLMWPALINSFLMLAFAVNYMTGNKPQITGLLSGILLGIAAYIFF